MKNSKVGFFRKMILILITKLQENALKSEFIDIYHRLFSIHFYIYFGMTMSKAESTGNDAYLLALTRNSAMRILFKHPLSENETEFNDIFFKISLQIYTTA